MKNLNRLTVGVVAVVLAVAVAGGAYAMWGGGDGDDGQSTTQNERQANPDGAGDDVIGGQDGGIAATCIEGTVDCVDTPLGGEGEGTGLGMCAPGVTDCVDVVVGEDADCAADGPACGPDVLCDYGYEAEGCAPTPDCVVPQTAIEGEATLTPEELERLKAQCDQPAECDDTPGARCLPPDCAVSSDGSIACPDDGGSGEDGSAPGAGSGSSEGEPGQVDPVAPDAGAER